MDKNVQVVRRFYMAEGQDDWDAVLALLREEVNWHVSARPQTIPYAGHHQGHEAVLAYLDTLRQTVERHEFGPREIIPAGEQVVVVGHERGRVKSTDRFYETEWVHLFTVQGGQITQLREFYDTASVAAAFQ